MTVYRPAVTPAIIHLQYALYNFYEFSIWDKIGCRKTTDLTLFPSKSELLRRLPAPKHHAYFFSVFLFPHIRDTWVCFYLTVSRFRTCQTYKHRAVQCP